MRAFSAALVAGLLLGAPLFADAVSDGEALAKKSDCLSCHQPDRKVVGPAYKDVAKKYKGQAGIVAKLTDKVIKGGSGNWGAVPMSPHPTLPKEDVEKMVKWVLAGAPMGGAAAAPAAEAKAAPTAVPTAAPAKAAGKDEPKDGMPRRAKKRHAAATRHEGEGEVLAWGTDDQVRASMEKMDCMGCHAGVNSLGDPETKPWPSFKQIETKYHSGADVAALVKKVKDNEGNLKWGKIPHPTYDKLASEDVEKAVRFVLAGKASQAPAAASTAEMGAEEWMKTRSDCFSCHQVTVKVVGPAYRDVAKKYTDKDVAMLVKKVKAGGSGNWGNVPMAAHPNAPDAMLEKAVRWVLSQK